MGKGIGECWRNWKYSLIDYVINRLMHGVDAHCSFLNPKPESAPAPSPSVFPSYSPKQETRVRADESLPITKRAKTRADVTGVLYLLSPCDHLCPRLPFSSSYIICSILSLLLFLILLILLLQNHTVTLTILTRFKPDHSYPSSRMAIHPRLRPQGSQGSLSPQQTLAISAWTEQAASSLQDLSLSDATPNSSSQSPTPARSTLRGSTVSLSIPLDDQPPTPSPRVKVVSQAEETRPPTVSFRRREPLRRDSLKRREALLKGKDGSRRRQRWENGMRYTQNY